MKKTKMAYVSVNDVLEAKMSEGRAKRLKAFHHKTLEERTADFGGELNLDSEWNIGDPAGREIW